ncbi:MAG: bifunctional metallophosphatase/5'-nucleotidase, partial [Candidatus Acidiferrales bacterium]
EVVYGPKAFRQLLNEVKYKVICYNFQESKNGKRIFPASTILESQGVRVAFVGVTDPTTTTRQPPAEVKGLDSTHIEGLRSYVQQLKATEHPDLVVLVDHTGLAPSVQLAHDIPEFDIVLSAHTHERVYRPILVGHTIVVEPGSLGSFLGKLDITLKDGKIADTQYQLVYVSADRFKEDPGMKALVEHVEKPYRERLDKVVGSTKTPLMRDDVLESTMDDLVADSVREATHSDIALTNGFRFSPPIAPGPITEADLWNILPLDAKMKVGEVTGKQLHSYLENEMELVFAQNPFTLSGGWGPRPSGMDVVFHAKAPKGNRIRSIKVDGKDVADSAVYTLGGCERDGEPMNMICRMHDVRNAHYVPGTIHSALEAYIRKHSPLDYRREGRVRADDLPPVVWSQYGILQEFWNLPGTSKATRVPGGN